jgi:uncharacterized membrane protein
MQWSAVLSLLLFLAAWHFLLSGKSVGASIFLLAAALCSSRGMIVGAALAVFVLCGAKVEGRVRRCLFCLAPAVLVVGISSLFAPQHSFAAVPTLRYAAEYLSLNPLFLLLPFLHVKFSVRNPMIFGVVKLAVIVWAFRKATPSIRPLLWTRYIRRCHSGSTAASRPDRNRTSMHRRVDRAVETSHRAVVNRAR